MRKTMMGVSIIVAMALTGCGTSPVSAIESYLEKTYNEEFEYITTINGSPIPFSKPNVVTAQFKCDKYENNIVTASYTISEGKTTDNIPALEYYENINGIIDKTMSLSGITNYVKQQRIPDMVIQRTNNYTYEDYLTNWQWKRAVVITEQEINQQNVDIILNYLETNKVSLNIRIAQIDSYENIDDYTELFNISASKYISKSVNIEANAKENTFQYKWVDF